ncbi:g3231 [Coccomyxa viridis]|uniref:Hypoxanthine phosphoribosyltransferase n=1 Tax=Coccomyxa viridis TaxID=1274662 RepID=A0ABP1FPK6_9CHLO
MGRTIAEDFEEKEPLIIGTLNGAFVFMADLVRAVQPVPEGLNMDFLRASSYTGAATTGQDAVEMGLVSKIPIHGRHILLVEDIIDTGKTLQELCSRMRKQGAASVSTVTLLDKVARRVVDLEPDYRGFECPDEFVVGYGLDYDEQYRSLPYVGVLRPECYMET